MVTRRFHPKKFFTEEEKNRIVRAIRETETKTSGEIRIYVERKTKGEIMTRAKKVFERLGMTRTKHCNGVLIYFSLADRSFAILGDQGLHTQVGDSFWKEAVAKIEEHFKRDDFAGGLEAGIHEIGARLRQHFPRERGDLNELPDEVAE